MQHKRLSGYSKIDLLTVKVRETYRPCHLNYQDCLALVTVIAKWMHPLSIRATYVLGIIAYRCKAIKQKGPTECQGQGAYYCHIIIDLLTVILYETYLYHKGPTDLHHKGPSDCQDRKDLVTANMK